VASRRVVVPTGSGVCQPAVRHAKKFAGKSGCTRLWLHGNPVKQNSLRMDILFNCPHCGQELEVDSEAAGTELNCPTCGEILVVPSPNAPGVRTSGTPPPQQPPQHAHPPGHEAHVINPIASSAAAKEEKHFHVPIHEKPAESLISKPLKPLEAAPKETEKRVRVKTIRRIDCVEVGRDRFDEIVTDFLAKVGEENIISVNTLNYTYLDIGSQKLLTDFGVLVVYRG